MGIREIEARLMKGATVDVYRKSNYYGTCETCGSEKNVYIIEFDTETKGSTISWHYRICRACVKALAK